MENYNSLTLYQKWKPWHLGLTCHVVDVKTKNEGWPPWPYKQNAMCIWGSMWCGRDGIPWVPNCTKELHCSRDKCEKKSIRLPFPNEGVSKMKEIVNGTIMWCEKDVAFK